MREFYKHFYKCHKDDSADQDAVIGALLKARESTKDEYSDVWNEAAKMKQVISYFLYNGTMHILDENITSARTSAFIARFYDQWLKVNVHQSQACIDSLKMIETFLYYDMHSRVKYFWRRIPCSCLDERYKEVKSTPKMGQCCNTKCAHPDAKVERSKLRCCSRCRSVTYCSRGCQRADWSVHKKFCDKDAATRRWGKSDSHVPLEFITPKIPKRR